MRRSLVLFAFLLTACRGGPATEARYLCALEDSAVRAYPLEATGPVKPVRSFGDQVGLRLAWPIAVIDDEILITDSYPYAWPQGRTAYYARTDQGNVAPRHEAPSGIFATWNAKHREFLLLDAYDRISGLSEDGGSLRWELKTRPDWSRQVVFDEGRDQILVFSQDLVRAYPYGAAGDAAPVRQFALDGYARQTDYIFSMEMDGAHDELLALIYRSGPGVLLNAYTSSGQLIRSASLGELSPSQFVYSAGRDEVLLLDGRGNSILAFPRASTGQVKPSRTLSFDAEVISFIGDSGHDELIVTLFHGAYDAWREWHSSVVVYAQAAEGNAAPLRVIDGSSSGAVNAIEMVADPVTRVIHVAASSPPSIVTFTGGDEPARTIAARALDGLALGFGEVFALDTNEVTVFGPGGAAQSSFGVSGYAYGIAYDDERHEVWLTNYVVNKVVAQVYTRTGALLRTSAALAGFFGFGVRGEVWTLSAGKDVVAAYPVDAQGDDPSPLVRFVLRHPATGRPLFVADRGEIYVPVATGVEVYSSTHAGEPLRTLQGVKATRLAECR